MPARRQPENASLGYSDTPVLEGTPWHVHDGERPQPPVVTPGIGTQAPSDAKVVFDGTHLRDWEGKDGQKRQRTEIVADNVIMLDRPQGQGQGGAVREAVAVGAPAASTGGQDEIRVEDIPF